MTQNNQQQPNEADALFASMRTINPVRDDLGEEVVPSEGADAEQDLDERMESSRKMSDIQVIDRRLNPDLKVHYLNVQTMGRVFPDSYTPLFRIQVKDLVKNHGFSVPEAITLVNTSLSMAIDGEHILDEIQISRQGAISSDEDKAKGGI